MKYAKHLLTLATLTQAATGCLSQGNTRNSVTAAQSESSSTARTSAATSTTATIPAGPRAAKFIFRQSASAGSFNAPPASGTVNQPGSGHKAVRVFNPDGSLLASGTPETVTWPKWLSDFEIGVSGTSNAYASNPDCARFSAAGEDTNFKCAWDQSTSESSSCGGPPGYYRVSEYDCTNPRFAPVASVGTGGPQDGIYVRAKFNRTNNTYLGTSENILVVIEYAASALKSSPADVTTNCYTGQQYTPGKAGCADQLWQVFFKHNSFELVPAAQTMVPPQVSYVNSTTNTGGGVTATRQYLMPMSSDANLSVFQLSRITAFTNPDNETNDYYKTCQLPQGSHDVPSNSPLCVGVVLYSITFFRI